MVEERAIRVFLLDGDDAARAAMAGHLADEPGLSVVGEAPDAAAALRQIAEARPDVVVLDLFLPDGQGVDVCRDIRATHPEIACLVLTAVASEELLGDALVAGAAGYILKGAAFETIAGGLRAVAAGRGVVDPSFVARLLAGLKAAR